VRAAPALLLLAALAACAHSGPGGGPAIAECPGELAAPSSIGGEFLLRLRMRVEAPGVDRSLELAVQKRGDELVLVAFDPLGAVAFSVVQSDDAIRVEERLPAALLPLPPRNALRDLHRARFLGAVRDRVEREGCGYSARFVELSREALP